MDIVFEDMVQALFKPGQEMIEEFTAKDMEMIHAVIGLTGEAGELSEPFLLNIHEGEVLDIENVIEELGDFEFYLEKLRTLLGIPRSDCVFLPPKETFFSKIGGCLFDWIETTPDYSPRSSDVLNLKVSVDHLVVYTARVLDLVKKQVVYRKKDPKISDLTYHLQGVEKNLHKIRNKLDISRKEILNRNIEKLGRRYKEMKYSNESAQARKDKQGE